MFLQISQLPGDWV